MASGEPGAQAAAIARRFPGYGGFYNESGRPVFLFTDTARGRAMLRGVGEAEGGIHYVGATIRCVRWDAAELYDWFRYVDAEMWRISGITMAGVNGRENRIEFGFADSTALLQAEARLRALGVPDGLVHAQVLVVRDHSTHRALAQESRPAV